MKKHLKKYFLLLIISAVFTACEKGNDDPGPGTESETAILAGHRVNTPGGQVFYMGAYPDIPAQLDVSEMVELGTGVRIHAYGEHPYVWNGNSSTLTKYNVASDLTISVADILSFASTGLSGDFGPPAFFSETQAYFFALPLGKIIEFDPTAMEIVEVIDVTPLEYDPDPNADYNAWDPYISDGGKVILPIGTYPVDLNTFPDHAQIAVFDPATKSISYTTDDRMSMGYESFALDENGGFYYRPASSIARAEDYGTQTGHPTTGGLLKVNSDGTFDPDFFVDLKEVLNAHSVKGVVYVFDSKAVVSYLDASFSPPADPGEWYSAPTSFALVDLEALTYEPFTAFEKYGTVYSIGVVNGDEYFGTFGGTSGKYYALKRNSPTDLVEVSEAIGGSYRILTQLW